MRPAKWILGALALLMASGCYSGPRRAYYGRPGYYGRGYYGRPAVYVQPAPVYVSPGPVYARPVR